MTKNFLWHVSLITTPADEDAASALLGEAFATNASIFSDALKKKSIVSVYSEKPRTWISGRVGQLQSANRSLFATVRVRKLPREDWAESWKRHFQPLEIGRGLLVKPSWSKRAARKGQALVILDPGLSFGTGKHPTTAFCLRQLVCFPNSKKPRSFLDIGTGSGILAISAAKLGYQAVKAFDFDPEAVRIAKANAKANRVGHCVSISQQNLLKLPVLSKERFDFVCANLISDLLVQQREKILSRLKSTGILVLAGILQEEFGAVQRAYEIAGMKLFAARSEKEWRSGAFRFRA